MTDEELQAIKARAEAATKGPWKTTQNIQYGAGVWSLDGTCLFRSEAPFNHSVVSEVDPVPQWKKDIDFVRAAREDIPALIAEIEELRKKVK